MKKFKTIVLVAMPALLLFLVMSFVSFLTGVSSAAALPDLAETSLSGLPKYAETGSSFSVTDTVKNKGNLSAKKSVTRYYLSLDKKKSNRDILLSGSRKVPQLPPNTSSKGTTKVSIPDKLSSGSYYLIVCADVAKQVEESNELNNCSASQATLKVITGFSGTYSYIGQMDDYIMDGITLNQLPQTIEIVRVDSSHLKMRYVEGGETLNWIPLVQKGNMITLPIHPYPVDTYSISELILMSDGNNFVLAHIGQDSWNPAAISLLVANWVKKSKSVSVDDFVGTWNFEGYGCTNLRAHKTGNVFSTREGSAVISKADKNTITVDSAPEEPFSLQVANDRATLIDAPVIRGSGMSHALSITNDGSGFSLYMVGTELDDPTDVSVTILLGTKQ